MVCVCVYLYNVVQSVDIVFLSLQYLIDNKGTALRPDVHQLVSKTSSTDHGREGFYTREWEEEGGRREGGERERERERRGGVERERT